MGSDPLSDTPKDSLNYTKSIIISILQTLIARPSEEETRDNVSIVYPLYSRFMPVLPEGDRPRQNFRRFAISD
jgi:hypothetical protein